jgi:hypothetical protein
MDRPAGGLRFDAVLGIPIKFDSEGLTPSGPGRHQPQPLTRHVVNQSPTLGSTSHMHQLPANQTNGWGCGPRYPADRGRASAPSCWIGRSWCSMHSSGYPLTRHVVNQSPTLGSTSHMHQLPANQTNNRLPPLSAEQIG